MDDIRAIPSALNQHMDDLRTILSALNQHMDDLRAILSALNQHMDELRTILSALNYNFDGIVISEHKITGKEGRRTVNINIPGYHNFIFQPTDSSHDGTGFYLKHNLIYNYCERKDFACNSVGNLESSFIEIQFPKNHVVVGCI